MKVSVITVCRNSAATIGDTLRSLAAQTHAELEHLVIDGASTDGTQDLVRSLGTRYTVLVSEPDRGIYDAMNKGLRLATGDCVGFLNADDMLASPEALARIAQAAAGSHIVYGDLEYLGVTTGRVVRHWRSGHYRRDRLRYGWMPPHPTFYVKRDLPAVAQGFDTTLSIAADYDFMTRCLLQPGIAISYVPEVLVRMRLGGASNASARGMLRKSREDLLVMRRHGLGGWFTLASKNLRKLPQFVQRS
ncbi:glycosyltransferase family 2 protein [uncultured Methylibium sp.]|uniref:glycosyltransferase family 2 protein n=1 Tax=uncultured Methylibium sp. TaxID=381093 RepID=UPI0025CCB222|nr:glycosyltransferase family 2 protein [uncultured Methylibium sp.]